ncbi:DNA (cytosine-5)-methyltransferase 1 [Candidatus Termititenax persephonae]|uniref:Cytosine-specific methyltransferase n=1 Tax=Candidatus Termititenax persephonae TaxID=2218525 RepID=A0A388TFS9_9BACT|nr:DNA (cytosine-5)-methyltransferase 1 [Candidatus Termititenax persephonae]
MKTYKYIDLFCGIGGFRYAMEAAARKNHVKSQCVFSSDIDAYCQDSYEANFGERPAGDISKINAKDIPNHDILLAGFPCQPFSIIGQMRGFNDTRGTLFFEIARIIAEKKPQAFVLENVKLLVGHNKGQTIKTIVEVLELLDYKIAYRVLNALNFGLPQKRERIFIIGLRNNAPFSWSKKEIKMKSLDDVLEKRVNKKYFVSEKIKNKRLAKKSKTAETTIWHENKAGNISAYPYSCALRAGASYNYLLVNGERRLTEREMLRLQGFQESFKIIQGYTQARKQAGNSLPIPVAESVISNVLLSLAESQIGYVDKKYFMLENVTYETPKTANSRKTPIPVPA